MAWRASLKEVTAEERLLNHELYQKARPVVTRFVERLQNAASPEDFFRLHLDVLQEFAARQVAVSDTLPGHKARTRSEIKSKIATRTPTPELSELQARLRRVKELERAARAIQHALRVVADGIAWKALDYNRAAITVLGRGRRVGRLAIGRGFDVERAALVALWEREHLFAIHNDITNCLRHGDLTVIRFGTTKEVNLSEVKASTLAGAGKQLRRIDDVIEILTTGEYHGTATDMPKRIVQVGGPYETYLYVLRELVAEARQRRFAWSRPHGALAIGAIDYGVPDQDGTAAAAIEAMKRSLNWSGPQRGFRWTGAERRLRDRGDSPSHFAPLSIYPLPASDVADLILGFVDTIVYLDIPHLENAFAAEGLIASVARPPKFERRFLDVTDGRVAIAVPPEVREVMLNELTTPSSIIRAVRALMEFTRTERVRGTGILTVFTDESRSWDTASITTST